MATVIFSNMGDTDTAVLKYIWMGMPKDYERHGKCQSSGK